QIEEGRRGQLAHLPELGLDGPADRLGQRGLQPAPAQEDAVVLVPETGWVLKEVHRRRIIPATRVAYNWTQPCCDDTAGGPGRDRSGRALAVAPALRPPPRPERSVARASSSPAVASPRSAPGCRRGSSPRASRSASARGTPPPRRSGRSGT